MIGSARSAQTRSRSGAVSAGGSITPRLLAASAIAALAVGGSAAAAPPPFETPAKVAYLIDLTSGAVTKSPAVPSGSRVA